MFSSHARAVSAFDADAGVGRLSKPAQVHRAGESVARHHPRVR